MATLADLVAASGNFDNNDADYDILSNSITAAGLNAALADPTADLTLFAPTDAAFLNLAEALGYDGTSESDAFTYIVDALTLLSGGADPIPLLTNILKYHVAPESLTAAEIGQLASVATLLGSDIGVDGTALQDADPDFGDAHIVSGDVAADNGLLQGIDGVLLPLDILQSDGSNDVDFDIGDDRRNVFSTGRDDDFLSGKGGRDQLVGGKGDDVVLGGDGDDHVFGGKGDDTVMGDAGRDKVFAGQGDDLINGGAGDDVLRGFKGNDTFVFSVGNEQDTIRDFQIGQDVIDVSAFGITSFDDLEIDSGRHFTILDFGDDTLAIQMRPHKTLDEGDFIFA